MRKTEVLPLPSDTRGPHFQPSKPRRRKFRPGERIERLGDLVRYLEHGQWIYLRDKPVHPSFLLCWQLGSLLRGIHCGTFRLAVRIAQ